MIKRHAGIRVKLFIALFSTCILLLITMHWGVRLSFEHGFIDYIKRGNQQRLEMLSDALADKYEQHGNWDFLRHNNRLLVSVLRSLEQAPDAATPLPPHGFRTPFWIIDQHHHVLIGPPAPLPHKGTRHPIITSKGQVVGMVIGSPPERLTRRADIHFDKQQARTSWLIVGFSILLAAAVTWLMSRGLLAPVRTLVEATHRLAAGEFTARVKVGSRDELGLLAQDFNRLACSLEKNQQMRHAFMADISHELRTPLAILHGELEAIQDGVRQLTPQAITSLQTEVALLTRLVNDLHQLSLSDEGALDWHKQETDLVTLLEVTAAGFRERYRQQSLFLTLSLPEKAPFFGDPDRLMQLFSNLMENSLRYTNAGGGLLVTMTRCENAWRLAFADTPPGVPEKELPHLFRRFHRTERSRNRASGGAGLGLAICQNIVQAHDGTINATHAAAGGLQITLNLPKG